ncbi:nitrate ABC transporter permease [Arthrobacter sp. MYb227]|uniref:ABC transporter permease n=1 Tax=Arthrobacter sp. MYb227 TaxID=1848601 RepID=UPI000CFDA35A|nr:ABC transporter permease subunit [Arthrobacter sp. MYb227]PQZ96429.1 nitrate ABC transporter permease [Arthrobacter sp. MYb227]
MTASSSVINNRIPAGVLVLPKSVSRRVQAAWGIVGALIMLGIWQVVAMAQVFGTAVPTVVATFAELLSLLGTSAFWSEVGITVLISLAGLTFSAVLGILLGILIGTSPVIRALSLAIFEFLKPIPPIVILPLAVMVLGPTWPMAFVLVAFGCSLAIVMQTASGVQDTDPVALSTARSYGMKALEIKTRIVLPSASPYIGTAMRVAAPTALVITVVAGLLGGAPGLGKSIYQAQAAGNTDTLFALVTVLGLLGLVFHAVSTWTEAKALHWHPSHREVSL